MNILFRCDGSVDIGMGHISRCIALAEILKRKHNCNIIFAMRKSKLGIDYVKKNFIVESSQSIEFDYFEWLTNIINKNHIDILILDVRDGLTRDQLKKIKKKRNIKIVTIDDPEEKRLESDFAFYPPLPQLSEISWNKYQGNLYFGYEYIILKKEFSKIYSRPSNSIRRLFVSMGATDQNNMTSHILDILNEINHQIYIDIVIGKGYCYIKQLTQKLKNVKFAYELHHNPSNLANIISQCNLGLVSFGVTAYELISCKVPILILSISKDHMKSASSLFEAGCAINLGLYKKLESEKVIHKINYILSNSDQLHKMSNFSNNLIDGRGANRIAKIITR